MNEWKEGERERKRDPAEGFLNERKDGVRANPWPPSEPTDAQQFSFIKGYTPAL